MKIVIPARYASTRLPGKPLLDIAGKPLIQRVYNCALDAEIGEVVIATDDARIRSVAEAFGARVVMTRSDHESGTDRLAEVVENLGLDEDEIVVNLQGDEPLMPAALIQQVAALLDSKQDAVVGTACHAITDCKELLDANTVKVVLDHEGYALYFSRAPIPYPRNASLMNIDQLSAEPIEAYRHIGLYAYRAGFIRTYTQWHPAAIELTEKLEQLRVLWRGYRIAVVMTESLPGPGVDTESDLALVREHFNSLNMLGIPYG
ncbi:MAG: 3-deoxy-manno-octulosonate cytidylyltransferase [Gammaproteobacteria bacterium]|nr:MAG: 3-deoxy-manno-octulosonate cytidylyltransferase [Gammaproteobacteria bacterium]